MMEAVLDKGMPWPTCGDPTDTQANAFVKVRALLDAAAAGWATCYFTQLVDMMDVGEPDAAAAACLSGMAVLAASSFPPPLPLPCMCAQVPAIVARYAGQPSLAEAVQVAVRAQQNNDGAVMWAMAAARILERVVLVSGKCANHSRSQGRAVFSLECRCLCLHLGPHTEPVLPLLVCRAPACKPL